ncbi:MAG: hypothetical protein IJ817_03155 [Clostridia bacterium]|nr:hypothetical protein [Clostridia bacterium]
MEKRHICSEKSIIALLKLLAKDIFRADSTYFTSLQDANGKYLASMFTKKTSMKAKKQANLYLKAHVDECLTILFNAYNKVVRGVDVGAKSVLALSHERYYTYQNRLGEKVESKTSVEPRLRAGECALMQVDKFLLLWSDASPEGLFRHEFTFKQKCSVKTNDAMQDKVEIAPIK